MVSEHHHESVPSLELGTTPEYCWVCTPPKESKASDTYEVGVAQYMAKEAEVAGRFHLVLSHFDSALGHLILCCLLMNVAPCIPLYLVMIHITVQRHALP